MFTISAAYLYGVGHAKENHIESEKYLMIPPINGFTGFAGSVECSVL